MTVRSDRRVVVALSLVLILALTLVPPLGAGSAAEPRRPLTAEEVACDRARLGALLERSEVTNLGGGVLAHRVHLLFVAPGGPQGSIDGTVVGTYFTRFSNPPIFPPGPESASSEHLLAFHLDSSVRRLLLNPERPPLPQISLTRETSTSTLVAPTDPFEVLLAIRPTLSGVRPYDDPGSLVIDNLAVPPVLGPGFRAADTKPGRGLAADGLTAPCDSRHTAADHEVFAILQRTLRLAIFDFERPLTYDARIALYRREASEEYGADVYLIDPATGVRDPDPLVVLLQVALDGDRRLTAGRIEVVHVPRPGAADVGGIVYVIRPLFAGVQGRYDIQAGLPFRSDLPLPEPAFLRFDWRDVLANSAWNRP